jgi:coenzyme F420-reducing hydrogenase beta subunit
VKPEKVYACYNKDKDVRLSSSSGAVFSSLAEYVLNKSGIVYGVAMSEDCYSAEFIGVTDSEGLTKLRGSKYLQAKVGNTFKSVKKELQAGKLVLFTGTGCQVNGLKTFLGKDYDNLICMDVICHGAPSPALWREYARDQEKKMGGKLKEINFRCKDDSWVDFGMKEVLSTIPEDSVKKFYISKDKDPYMQMFLRDYCLRPSCYECMVKKEKMSDLTVADFWGIKDVAPEMNNGLGTSLVLIRTKKGQEIFNYISCEMKLKEVTYEAGVKGNPAEYKSCVRPSQRDTFFDDMHTMSFEELEGKYAPPIKYSLKTRAKRKTKKIMKSMLRVIGGAESNVEYGLLFVFRV